MGRLELWDTDIIDESNNELLDSFTIVVMYGWGRLLYCPIKRRGHLFLSKIFILHACGGLS
jgi:hypothetical protein